MKPSRFSPFLSLVVVALGAGGPMASAQDADNATERAKARYEWYNDTRGRTGRTGGVHPRRLRAEGVWPAEFRRFMMEAAERERLKWGALIPGHGDVAPALSPEDRAAAGGGANWLNIGPTKANFIFNGITLFVTDTGRVRSFAMHPTDANTMYVAFSGGGVWKTINGGANWTPLTEGLGSLSVGWLAMDPGNPNTLYLGLGDPYLGAA